ncbi:MAG: hypothetical protein Q4D96_06540 [Propionibacteriaceae bacterium]|nr:hypothetical protein [Propionibacteriaceae bacterium]
MVPSRNSITCWGDSLTEGGSKDGIFPLEQAWPAQMAEAFGGAVRVTNRGRCGETTDGVGIRCGALQVWARPHDSVIPEQGRVQLHCPQLFDAAERSFEGSLAGVGGTLVHQGGTWFFERAEPGEPVRVEGPAPFISGLGDSRGDVLIHFAGTNNHWADGRTVCASRASHVIAAHQRFLTWAGHDRVLFIGLSPATTSQPGDALWQIMEHLNTWLAANHPGRFFDFRTWLREEALEAAGITPQPEDLAARAELRTPPSVMDRGDDVHFNTAVHAALGRRLAAELTARGWIDGDVEPAGRPFPAVEP